LSRVHAKENCCSASGVWQKKQEKIFLVKSIHKKKYFLMWKENLRSENLLWCYAADNITL
jgi:hypothetical protein